MAWSADDARGRGPYAGGGAEPGEQARHGVIVDIVEMTGKRKRVTLIREPKPIRFEIENRKRLQHAKQRVRIEIGHNVEAPPVHAI